MDLTYWFFGVVGAAIDSTLITYYCYKKENLRHYKCMVALITLLMIGIRLTPNSEYQTFIIMLAIYLVMLVKIKKFWIILYMVLPFVLVIFFDVVAYSTVFKINPYFGLFTSSLFKCFAIKTFHEIANIQIKGHLMQITLKIILLMFLFCVACISSYIFIIRVGV